MKEKKLRELFQEEEEEKLILPNFQREFVWSSEQQKSLLATYLVDLPISSLLLLKGNNNEFNSRKLCRTEEVNSEKDECLYLLDGQQRLSTLKAIFCENFGENWKDDWDNLYNKIKNLWFLRVRSSDRDDEDVFGYKNLNFMNKNLKKYTPSELLDFIEYYKINKTTKIEWYHPGFIFRDENNIDIKGNSKIITEKSKEFSERELIPLFGMCQSDKVQKKTIDKIAKNRAEAILSEIEDIENEAMKMKKIEEVFIDSEIETLEEFEEEKNEMSLDLAMKWKNDMLTFLNSLLEQEISLIEIEKNEISRGIAIFETINKGGTPLDNFDLIVAKAAKTEKKEENLTEQIKKLIEKNIDIPSSLTKTPLDKWNAKLMKASENNDINKRFKNQYLNLLSIFSHIKNDYHEIKLEHIKRDKIFEVSSENINSLTEKTINSLSRALCFLNYRLGCSDFKSFSYELLILPIAYLLSRDEVWNNKEKLNKLEYWYWTSIFTGRYREKQNVRTIVDLKILCKWILEENETDEGVKELLKRSDKVLDVEDFSDLDVLLNNVETPTAISRNILGYILSKNPCDLLPNKINKISADLVAIEKELEFENDKYILKLEEHHLIPVGEDKRLGESSKIIRSKKNHILNSILNKALISSYANKKISNLKLAKYLEDILAEARISNFIPTSYERHNEEKTEIYYKRMLKQRFDKLRDDLLTHLMKLKG